MLEGDQLNYPEEGTPQGGLISPILSNIYLHYVLDEWFEEEIQPRLRGNSFMVRYADDFVLGFEYLSDAERVFEVLRKRMAKYKLTLHAEKTRIINLNDDERGHRSFDFLGFTHYMGKNRKGRLVLQRKTSSKKLNSKIVEMNNWLKLNRSQKLKELLATLNRKLRGHYNYYGITFNLRGITRYYRAVVRLLYKWLNRRGGKRKWTWSRITSLVNEGKALLMPPVFRDAVPNLGFP